MYNFSSRSFFDKPSVQTATKNPNWTCMVVFIRPFSLEKIKPCFSPLQVCSGMIIKGSMVGQISSSLVFLVAVEDLRSRGSQLWRWGGPQVLLLLCLLIVKTSLRLFYFVCLLSARQTFNSHCPSTLKPSTAWVKSNSTLTWICKDSGFWFTFRTRSAYASGCGLWDGERVVRHIQGCLL